MENNFQQNQIYAILLRYNEKFDADLCWDIAKEISGGKKTIDSITLTLIPLVKKYSEKIMIESETTDLAEKIFVILQPRSKFMDLYNSRKLHPENGEEINTDPIGGEV